MVVAEAHHLVHILLHLQLSVRKNSLKHLYQEHFCVIGVINEVSVSKIGTENLN